MRKNRIFCLTAILALAACLNAGQPTERFRGADHFTFSQGSADPRYGNTDCNVKITMDVFLLGTQVFNNPANALEARYVKTSGSLDFTIKLSDFDPTLPPDPITMTGADLGNDLMSHSTNTVLPGPYHVAGNFNGTAYDLTLSNVHVTGTLLSQGSNNVVLPYVNPILNELCDVQFDDPAAYNNSIAAVPATVSGWVVSPVFTVRSMRVDMTGIQQAGQVPAHIVAPTSYSISLGRLDGGDSASLAVIDGNTLRICKFLVPNQQVAPVTVEVNGSLASVPPYLSFASVSRMTASGLFQQTLDMFDFAGSGYTSGDARSDAITTIYDLRILNATGGVARYLGAGNAVKARYRVKQTGPASNPNWCVEHDLAGWVVTP